MKRLLLLTLSLLVCSPHYSFATFIDTVDDSDYGIQGIPAPVPCAAGVLNDSVGGAQCISATFGTPDHGQQHGFLVGYDSPVGNIVVTFSNVTITNSAGHPDAGLVVCGIDSDGIDHDICGFSPT